MKYARLYLIHIRECLARIQRYVASGRGEFMENTLIQDAVIRNLEVMGKLIM